MALTIPPPLCLLHSIFSTGKRETKIKICLFFLPFDRKQYFEASNYCTQRLTRHNLFDAKSHTLMKWCGCFCIRGTNGFIKTFSADVNTS